MSEMAGRRARDVLTRQLEDPELRAAWERLAPARAIAMHLLDYRIEHGLTQTALARRLDMTQSAVARLETGEHLPTIDTLIRLSRGLGVEVLVDIKPRGKPTSWVSDQASSARVLEETPLGDDGDVLIAMG